MFQSGEFKFRWIVSKVFDKNDIELFDKSFHSLSDFIFVFCFVQIKILCELRSLKQSKLCFAENSARLSWVYLLDCL